MSNQAPLVALPILGGVAATAVPVTNVPGDFAQLVTPDEAPSGALPTPVALAISLTAPPLPPVEGLKGGQGVVVVTGKAAPSPAVAGDAQGVAFVAPAMVEAADKKNTPEVEAPVKDTKEEMDESSDPDVAAPPPGDAKQAAPVATALSLLLPVEPATPRDIQTLPKQAQQGVAAGARVDTPSLAGTVAVLSHPADVPADPAAPRADTADPVNATLTAAPQLREHAVQPSHTPPAPLSVHSARFGEELGIAIARHADLGGGARHETLTVRLDPPEHGHIEVKLSFEDGGPLRVVVAASHASTLDLLRRDSADLSRALTQAGVGGDAPSLSFNAQGQDRRQGQASTPQSSFASAETEEASLPAREFRRLRTSGSLNLIA